MLEPPRLKISAVKAMGNYFANSRLYSAGRVSILVVPLMVLNKIRAYSLIYTNLQESFGIFYFFV